MGTGAEENIRRHIREAGRITFAEFMSLALYGPGGYYRSGQPVGAAGDYYTSPAAHPVFGAMLAVQLEQMWLELGKPRPFHMVEAAAGDGTLAKDILGFSRHLHPAFAESLLYVAVDGHPRPGSPSAATWVKSDGVPLAGVMGCILSNELLDALPVHRVRVHGGRLQELYLVDGANGLLETWGEPSPGVAERYATDESTLGEGLEGEVNLEAAQWIEEAGAALERGYVLTIDYGDTADRLYTSERSRGTVTGYFRHTQAADLYARIGQQDLTAHANFTTLIQGGKLSGLQPVTLMTQAEFLRNIGIQTFYDLLAQDPRDRQANLAALADLVNPDGLGRFRVLLQAKNAPARHLACLGKDPAFIPALKKRLEGLPIPRQTAQNINVIAGYPQPEAWVEGRWEDLLGEDDPEPDTT